MVDPLLQIQKIEGIFAEMAEIQVSPESLEETLASLNYLALQGAARSFGLYCDLSTLLEDTEVPYE